MSDLAHIEIAVVGAHLSGMALNPDLLREGARLRRAVDTQPIYRLYALAGGPPRRPGLLRVGPGGLAIATEVWELPAAGFGRFVARIPPPLCIGTLLLADGSQPKGFLVEPQGLHGAEDISRFGGWRAYLASLAPA
jgi:allophanate hydrolase